MSESVEAAKPSEDTTKKSVLSTRKDFDGALALTAQMVESGTLWWRISSEGVEARLDEQKVEVALPEEVRENLDRVLDREIIPAVEAALFDESPRIALSTRFQDVSEEDFTEYESRAAAVKGPLVTLGLTQRAIIRRTSKGPALDDIRWDISIKKHGLAEGQIKDVPYATIEVVYSTVGTTTTGPPFSWGMSTRLRGMLGLGNPQAQSIYFDCHAEDLDALIRDLQQVRDNLRRLSSPST